MSYVYFNPNPSGKRVGDCVIRAISKLTNRDWQSTYLNIAMKGYELFDMPSSNNVWAEFNDLKQSIDTQFKQLLDTLKGGDKNVKPTNEQPANVTSAAEQLRPELST